MGLMLLEEVKPHNVDKERELLDAKLAVERLRLENEKTQKEILALTLKLAAENLLIAEVRKEFLTHERDFAGNKLTEQGLAIEAKLPETRIASEQARHEMVLSRWAKEKERVEQERRLRHRPPQKPPTEQKK